jgi:hypothetical protein
VIDAYSSPAEGVMFVAVTSTPASVSASRRRRALPWLVFDVWMNVHPVGWVL